MENVKNSSTGLCGDHTSPTTEEMKKNPTLQKPKHAHVSLKRQISDKSEL